ncbi:unnamed protein product [marine sediment metagenome]|uniref:Uncharacterized protein n=1 Tax=marine sediment metagenome TaxID=412755 RepID=X1B0D2_9ZZZZ
MWKDHSDYMKRKIKSGKRKAKKEDVLLDELQFTDDMILQSLMNAGIPINYPQQQQMLNPYQPTQHQSIAGTLITAYKLGMTAYTTAKGIQKGVKAIKRRRTKK